MIKKSVVGINAVVIICFTIILVYQKNGILLFLLALLLVGLYLLWADQQKEYQSELGEISIWLDDLLQKKDISYYSVQKDTLAAKILSQLQRVQKMYGGIATLVENERDGIKKLLAEIAHQLRTPLSNMETYLALLEDNSIGDAEKETYIKAVENRRINFIF